MESLNVHDCFREICKAKNKWGLYLNFSDYNYEELILAIPFLNIDDYIQDKNIFLFDTKEECKRHFDLVVGDDGPTKTNPYNGKIRVYALTCDNFGEFVTENT
jgi:hypothetical protein